MNSQIEKLLDKNLGTVKVPPGFDPKKVVNFGAVNGILWITYGPGLWGSVNGYAWIPPEHPWGQTPEDYDSIPVDIHGGLTYGDINGWVGFDTLHSGDVWPESPTSFSEGDYSINWTPESVADEARNLARQISRAG